MTGGDDYEVLAAIPDDQRARFEAAATKAGVAVRAIGGLTSADFGLNAVDESDQRLEFKRLSFDHFA